jgi:hypothetical protein
MPHVNADGFEVEVTTGRRFGPMSRPGDENPMAALTNDEARRLREYRQAGWTHTELGLLFGISRDRSSRIARGLAYKDAGGPIEGGERVYHYQGEGDRERLSERVLELHRARWSKRAIAQAIGRSRWLVTDVLEKASA